MQKMVQKIVIVGAARTPIGTLMGGLATVPAHELGAQAITAALTRAGVDPTEVDEAILGQVLTAGQGQNPARQAALKAGMRRESTAFGVNQICGSGLRAVALGMQQITLGDAGIVVAGGQESMSLAQHGIHMRAGTRMGAVAALDTMLTDGLTDAFGGYHMGVTAENVARKYDITRAAQDSFALASQHKAGAAQASGRFRDEIVPVLVRTRKGEVVVDADEGLRPQTSAEALAALRPVFEEGGSVTAGNASGLNDGAAALVLMSEAEAARRNARPLARIVAWAATGVDPATMGEGPISAVQRVLNKAQWSLDDVDLIESNEAFAAQACAVGKVLNWNDARVNVNGGAIALGHPIGASGARILVTLLYEMQRRNVRRGLATLCIGGGMGVAMAIERDAL